MLKRISLFALIALIITSCSEETAEAKSIEEYVSATMKGNDDVIVFGSVGIKGILDKTKYKDEPMLAGLISTEMDKVTSVLNIASPVYYTVEGPVSKEGKAKRVMLFIEVKDADMLAEDLEKNRSFLIEEAGDIRYAEDDEFILAFRGNLAVAIIQQGKYNTEKVVKEIFEKSQGEAAGGKIDKMLKTKGDLVMNMSIERLYNTSNTDLAKLDAKTKKNLKKMVKDGYTQTILNFEEGGMSLEIKNEMSKELKDLMFFKSDKSSDLSTKLAKGNGEVVGGMSFNIDVKKMEKFYTTYAPEMMEELNVQMKEMGDIFKFIGTGNIMSTLLSGEVGALAIGNNIDGEFKMGVRSFFGAHEAGQKVFALARNEMDLPENGEFNYVDGGLEGLMPIEEGPINMLKGGALEMPEGSENFGKKGFYAFVNFNQVSRETLDPMEASILDMLDYATLEMDNDGAKMYLKMKNKHDNILEQVMAFGMKSVLPQVIGGGSPF